MTIQPPPYNPNVPQFPSDDLATTQAPLLNNFRQIYNKFLVNHIRLDSASDAGIHSIVELKEQENAFQTDLSEISVYTKDVGDQTDQIFLRYQKNGQEFQYTNYQLYSLQSNQFQTKFFTFLPGKILVYFGSFFPKAPPANVLDLSPYVAKNIITISLCPIDSTPNYKPNVKLLAPKEGVYQGIEVLSSTGLGLTAPSCYYTVMANL